MTTHVKIPTDWTPEEALDVAGFLLEIVDQIWLAHGRKMKAHGARLARMSRALEKREVVTIFPDDAGPSRESPRWLQTSNPVPLSVVDSRAMQRSDFVVEAEVIRDLGFDDYKNLGKAMDSALASMATGTLCRDEATLAHFMLVESAFYVVKISTKRDLDSYDALVCPVLDHIVPRFTDSRSAASIGPEQIMAARPWLRASEDYHSLVTGPINAAKGQMGGVEVRGGRLVFYPNSSFEAEIRNRWFSRRWWNARRQRGANVLERNDKTRAIVAKIDRHVAENEADLDNGFYQPPETPWYREHCEQIVDRVLEGQFEHMGQNERWAGLSREQLVRSIRPLYLRAAKKVFGHMRAYKFLRARSGKEAGSGAA